MGPEESMLCRWDYKNQNEQFCYGSNDSYLKSALFLDGLSIVEDWGCGICYAKQFFKQSKYIGIDGAASKWNDVVADLQEYRSKVDGILMRHILEHNPNWKTVLKNALESFQKKMCLIMFLEFTRITHCYYISPEGIPNFQFKKTDITNNFAHLKYSEEFLPETGETIFFLEKS